MAGAAFSSKTGTKIAKNTPPYPQLVSVYHTAATTSGSG
jgi:hypothetical protein